MKLDIVDYYISVNLFVNHIKITSSNIERIILTETFFFPQYKRIIISLSIILIRKKKIEKEKGKSHTKPIKKNYKKGGKSIKEIYRKKKNYGKNYWKKNYVNIINEHAILIEHVRSRIYI